MATSFHGFAVKEKIGAGGMSTVYKGAHETLGYPVAIKVLHPGMAGDQSFIARFEREAKAASSLRNNNIAAVIDFGSENDIYFIVMEFIDGHDIGQVFKDLQEGDEPKALPIEITLALLEEVAYGLRDAHERGIIHRDIKPSNILLSRNGEVKIADFGLARDTRDMVSLSDKDLTMPGTVVGTPSYMSPEQAAGTELDGRSDIFSLGVMAYQLIMGEKPFKGDTPTEVQERIINQDPPALSHQRCPLLTSEIENFVFKMMAKDPGRRYQNMEQVLRALSDCMESVDSSGSVIKYKRDYLSRFAKEPREFSDELRRKGISNHLKRGYHFKKMGLSNIDDALREFTYVLSLDPENEKAREAISELKHEAEQSGITPAYQPPGEDDLGRTQVMPSAPPPKPRPPVTEQLPTPGRQAAREKPKPPAPPAPADQKPPRPKAPAAKPAGGSRKIALYGGIGGAVAAVAIIAILLWPHDGGKDGTKPAEVAQAPVETPAAPTGTTGTTGTTGEPDAEAAHTPADGTATSPAEQPTQAPAEQPTQPATQPVTTAPQPTGTVAITSTPTGGAVYAKRNEKDEFQRLGTAPMTTGPLAAGSWEFRVEMSGYRGQSKVVTVVQNQERSLDFELQSRTPATPTPAPAAGPGWFRLVVSPFGDIYLDDNQVASSERVAVVRAAAGQNHTIRIHHPPTVGDIVLRDQKVTAGDTLNLGRQLFDVGTLRVAANVPCRLAVDGRALDGQTPLAVDRILVGERELTATKDGYVVDKLWRIDASGQRAEIRPIDAGATPRRYRVTIASGQELRVKFDLKPVDDQ